MTTPETIALVVAAGRGERLGGLPKQYRELSGKPVLRHCLDTLARHPAIGAVRAVIHPDHRVFYDSAASGLDLLPPVAGGATRQRSALNGLESLAEIGPSRVLIHDAARPLVDAPLIDRLIAALDDAPGAVAALPLTDTVKRAGDGPGPRVAGTVDRAGLWRAQTPQAFRYLAILDAHRAAAGRDLTDDAAVAEAAGLEVVLVMGSDDNLKITTEPDLARAERLIQGRAGDEWRTGSGIDVHAFVTGDGVVLCGVRVPHDRALAGHSDADAGLHAIADAILGAIGAGDIGSHFPPGDERWRGADSAQFLAHAASLVAARGGRIVHVDVTLVCERPKIAPHRAAMTARIAQILGLSSDRVSVKATTTEGLGFAGRGEGIVAQAVATVALAAGGGR